jgi:hypothetical protein
MDLHCFRGIWCNLYANDELCGLNRRGYWFIDRQWITLGVRSDNSLPQAPKFGPERQNFHRKGSIRARSLPRPLPIPASITRNQGSTKARGHSAGSFLPPRHCVKSYCEQQDYVALRSQRKQPEFTKIGPIRPPSAAVNAARTREKAPYPGIPGLVQIHRHEASNQTIGSRIRGGGGSVPRPRGRSRRGGRGRGRMDPGGEREEGARW